MSVYYSPFCNVCELSTERILNASGGAEPLTPTDGQWDDEDVNP